METEIFSLKLVSPLFYIKKDGLNPFSCREEKAFGEQVEKLFCFELDEEHCMSFESDKGKTLGKLLSCGIAANERADETIIELPRGDYLFAQKRKILGKEEIISLAFEIQSEGLWQRLVPGKMLYLRYLFEDGSPVTQLLRPY